MKYAKIKHKGKYLMTIEGDFEIALIDEDVEVEQ